MHTKRRDTDHRMFFIMGITFTAAGIAIGNIGIIGLGVLFMLAGLLNRSRWPENGDANR